MFTMELSDVDVIRCKTLGDVKAIQALSKQGSFFVDAPDQVCRVSWLVTLSVFVVTRHHLAFTDWHDCSHGRMQPDERAYCDGTTGAGC